MEGYMSVSDEEAHQHALQKLKSYHDLGDIDKTLHKPVAVLKQKKSGSRVVDSSKAKDKRGEAEAKGGATKWREWKARQPVEEMDVDPPADPDAVVQQKLKGKQKAQVVQKDNQTPIIESDLEI